MPEVRTCFIVSTGKPATHFLANHPVGRGYVWRRDAIGRHNAARFSRREQATAAAAASPKLAGRQQQPQVEEVTERSAIVIHAVSHTGEYWLYRIGQTTQYRWRKGDPGMLAAYRFESREAAIEVLRRYGGVSGVSGEIVERHFLDD